MKEEQVSPGFDLRTHIRDDKTGLLVRKQPYRMHAVKAGSGTTEIYERPVGSGNCWYKSGEVAGRMDGDKFIADAPHKQWTPPETADDRLAKEVLSVRERNNQLEKELEAVRKERKYSAPNAKKAGEAE